MSSCKVLHIWSFPAKYVPTKATDNTLYNFSTYLTSGIHRNIIDSIKKKYTWGCTKVFRQCFSVSVFWWGIMLMPWLHSRIYKKTPEVYGQGEDITLFPKRYQHGLVNKPDRKKFSSHHIKEDKNAWFDSYGL